MEENTLEYTVLVIEDSLGDFILIQDYLEEHQPIPTIFRATTFAEAPQKFLGELHQLRGFGCFLKVSKSDFLL